MNLKLAAFVAVTLAFGALSAVATVEHGYLGIFTHVLDTSALAQVGADLVFAMSFVVGWMYNDARKRGATVWPYLVAVPLVGSFAPLAYVIVRELTDAKQPESLPAAA